MVWSVESAEMIRMPRGWRLWLLVAVVVLFPIVFHPWWLLIISVAAYGLLVWLLLPPKKNSR
jgi:hypothetical protein